MGYKLVATVVVALGGRSIAEKLGKDDFKIVSKRRSDLALKAARSKKRWWYHVMYPRPSTPVIRPKAAIQQ